MPRAAAEMAKFSKVNSIHNPSAKSSKVSPRKHSEATDRTEDDEYSDRGSLKMNMEDSKQEIEA